MRDKKQTNFKNKKNKIIIILSIIKQYLANSNIHGVRYLVDENLHWSERLFWLMACGLSWWTCSELISSIIKHFIKHKSNITLETTYLNWEVEFPALHLCFEFSGEAKTYAANITGTKRARANYMTRLTKWPALGYDPSIVANISSEQFMIFKEYIKPDCSDIFGKCMWNDEELDCCEIFAPLETNRGQCLSFNSIHVNHPKNLSLPKFVMSHYKQAAMLTIYLNKTEFWNQSRNFFQILLTNVIEYPSQLASKGTLLSNDWIREKTKIWDIQLIPIFNEDGVTSVSYNDRDCRFISEIDNFRFLKVYSYQGCIVEAQMNQSQSLCGCVSHLFPSTKIYRTCNYTELKCAFEYKKEIVDINDDTCLPECEGTRITWYENTLADENSIPNWAVGKLVFNILPSPTLRYSRYTIHSLLDVIVSVGSTLGLFAGISILSIVELFYWIFLRCNITE